MIQVSVGLVEEILKPSRRFEYWESDEEFYKVAAKTPRSNCVMSSAKLASVGIQMTEVNEAIDRDLKNWQRN